jgi:plastocyanin
MKELVYILIIGVMLFAGCASNPPATTTTVAASSTTTLLASTTHAVTSTTHAASSTTQAESSTTTSIQAPTTTLAADMTVHISGFAFNPGTITVSKGTTVTWTNDDPTTHTIVSDSGSFTSGGLGKGNTFSRTFTEAGTFGYHCGVHPSMKGTVVVQ